MRVFMLGWEFAPIKSGGLGVACRGIAEGLQREGVDVTFALPAYINETDSHEGRIKVISKRFKEIKIPVNRDVIAGPYQSALSAQEYVKLQAQGPVKATNKNIYDQRFWYELARYEEEVADLAEENPHDVIHVHDWMTYRAGQRAKQISGKPVVAHVHATEMDRTAGNPNQYIYDREREGLEKADHIMVVSGLTKIILEKHYGISGDKISVVHNATVVHEGEHRDLDVDHFTRRDKIILYLGRVTVQKGPDYFLEAARRVLEQRRDIKFVIAGNGDMLPHIINKIIEYNLQDNVFCAGFLGGSDLERAFYHAKLYVMPSVSEPFGISALEAVEFGTPVLMSKTSGAAEVLKNCLKVDFWDTEKMANQMAAMIDLPVLGKTLVRESRHEAHFITWHQQAQKIKKIYDNLVK